MTVSNTHLRDEEASVVTRYLEAGTIPGAAVAVCQMGSVRVQGFGWARVEDRQPFTPDTVMPLASVSKSFTAAAVVRLAAEGRIDLDQPVARYLPYFRAADEAASQPITVRMLLSHTSGLGRTGHLDPDAGASYSSRRQLVEALASAALQTPPGVAWSYSNEAFSVCGHLVDAVSGSRYEEYVGERILAPLGMTASTTEITACYGSPARAYGYVMGTKGEPERAPDLPVAPASTPAGRICSTAADMARYLGALLGEAPERDSGGAVLPAEVRAELQRPSTTWGDTGWGYGLGWFIQHGPAGKLVSHGGNQTGVATYVLTLPAERLGVAVLCNLSGAPARLVAEEVASAALGRPVLRPTVADPLPISSHYQADADRLMEAVGRYRSGLGEVDVAVVEGRIHLTQQLLASAQPARLEALPVGPDLGALLRGPSEGQPLRFLRSGAGEVDRLLLAGTCYLRAKS